ncbi:class C beta-lactamase-related serine hydrolase [Rhodobacteraceae bacterium CCMM004]|nr:class C beta-lactamase-related serine hydrolase [Rhodobacteraceae bacterium CCMM004]
MTPGRRTVLAGLAASLAAPAVARAAAADWVEVMEAAQALDQLHSLSVARDGTTVLSERLAGPSLDRLHNVKSVSKTLVAALLGAAIDAGDVKGVEATLGAVAPGLIPPGADPRVADLTMADLVTMQAGLARTSGPNYGAWIASADWVADALGREMVAEPGARMLYSTGSFHVLGAALAEATGDSLLAQARARLGAPLGIDIPPWTRDPQGRYLGGNEMALTPAAMLRFGEMTRLGGTWEGTRVLSEAWVAASLTPRTRSPWSGLGYGYGWFLGRAGGTDVALARGYGGQVVAILPERAVTVAITSDHTRPARSQGYFGALMDLIGRIARV